MTHIKYSELTEHFYFTSPNKKGDKVDITDDIKEIAAFINSSLPASPDVEGLKAAYVNTVIRWLDNKRDFGYNEARDFMLAEWPNFPSPIQVTREIAEAWIESNYPLSIYMHTTNRVLKRFLDYLQSSQPQPVKEAPLPAQGEGEYYTEAQIMKAAEDGFKFCGLPSERKAFMAEILAHLVPITIPSRQPIQQGPVWVKYNDRRPDTDNVHWRIDKDKVIGCPVIVRCPGCSFFRYFDQHSEQWIESKNFDELEWLDASGSLPGFTEEQVREAIKELGVLSSHNDPFEAMDEIIAHLRKQKK